MKTVDISLNSIIPLEYDTDRISTRKKVSKFLRKNGNARLPEGAFHRCRCQDG